MPTAAAGRRARPGFREARPALSLEQMVGAAPEFRSALAVAAKAARNRLPILIIGEPGTGKETVARAIHAASLRAKGPLVIVDCKAVPANVIDSELFGHAKGAFPGAFASQDGRMLEADMRHARPRRDRRASALETQETLDRVLATGEVRPVGCNGSPSVDVRMIATSSRAAARRASTSARPSGSAPPSYTCRRCATAAATFPPSPATCSQRFAEQELIPPAVDRQ